MPLNSKIASATPLAIAAVAAMLLFVGHAARVSPALAGQEKPVARGQIDQKRLDGRGQASRRMAHHRPRFRQRPLLIRSRRSTRKTLTGSASRGTTTRNTIRGLEATPIVVDGVMYTIRFDRPGLRARRENRQRTLELRSAQRHARESARVLRRSESRRRRLARQSVRRFLRRAPHRARRDDRSRALGAPTRLTTRKEAYTSTGAPAGGWKSRRHRQCRRRIRRPRLRHCLRSRHRQARVAFLTRCPAIHRSRRSLRNSKLRSRRGTRRAIGTWAAAGRSGIRWSTIRS